MEAAAAAAAAATAAAAYWSSSSPSSPPATATATATAVTATGSYYEATLSVGPMRSLESYPLSASHLHLLRARGFLIVQDVLSCPPLELSQELDLPPQEVLAIQATLRTAVSGGVMGSAGGEEGRANWTVPSSSSAASATATATASEAGTGLGAGAGTGTGAGGESDRLSAFDLITKVENDRSIITFCKAIDKLLGGGIPIGQLTEICGVPAIGKTQFVMQLALNVQIPRLFQGNGGEAVFVDTEGSFMVSRAVEMAQALTNHIKKIVKLKTGTGAPPSELQLAGEEVTVDRLLGGIHYFRPHDQSELVAIIRQFESFLTTRGSRVKLIVIDSIAFFFRFGADDLSARNKLLSTLTQLLNDLAFRFRVAIVVVNHVTRKYEAALGAKPTEAQIDPTQRLLPALGEQWSHGIANRILLHWSTPSLESLAQGAAAAAAADQAHLSHELIQLSQLAVRSRVATLIKSASWPQASAFFTLNEFGIRDAPSSSGHQTAAASADSSSSSVSGISSAGSSKRPKLT